MKVSPLSPVIRMGVCWWRYQIHPWMTLMIAPFRWLFSSGKQCIHEEIRCQVAISRIDFVEVYEFLNDLLW
ncbi:MAG: hypothetical protein AAFW75_29555 [Cyanobacteria bacterium J06636_16]